MLTWQLLDPADLGRFLGRPVPGDRGDTALRVAAGWLQSATGRTDWEPLLDAQNQLPDDLWAWTLELAGYALENPTSLSERSDGEARRSWEESRRAEILAAAAEKYGIAAEGGARPGAPRFSFPEPWWTPSAAETTYSRRYVP